MNKIMGVQFQRNGKMYYFDANGIETEVGYYVIVDTVRGPDLAEVVMAPREMEQLQKAEAVFRKGSVHGLPEKDRGAQAGDETGIR